jgi:hypothetical protein
MGPPHIGQPGRSDAAGTEIVEKADIECFTKKNLADMVDDQACEGVLIRDERGPHQG